MKYKEYPDCIIFSLETKEFSADWRSFINEVKQFPRWTYDKVRKQWRIGIESKADFFRLKRELLDERMDPIYKKQYKGK